MERYEGGTKIFSVRLPSYLYEGLQEYADKLGQTKTELVIEAVASLLLMLKKEGR